VSLLDLDQGKTRNLLREASREPALVCCFRRKKLVVASTDKRVVGLVNVPMDRGRDPEMC
jgi:hypothetical protein